MAAITHQTPTLQAQHVFLPTPGHLPARQSRKERRQKYKNILFGLGLTELIMGFTFLILSFVNLGFVFNSNQRYYGQWLASPGIWCSTALIACGAVGIHTKKNSNMCMYNANMALSIVSSVMMGVLLIFSVLLALETRRTGLITVQTLLAFGSFAAMIVCIVHSAFCCAGICCTQRYYPGQVLYIPPQQLNNQQYVQLANGQYMLVQSQPPAGYQPVTYPIVGCPPDATQLPPSYTIQSSSDSEPAKVNESNTVVQQEYPPTTNATNSEPFSFPVTFDD